MRRAPLLVPAVVALLAIVAEQHGFVYPACAAATLACVATFIYSARSVGGSAVRATVVATAIAFGAGAGISALRGHPPVLATERATERYAATVTGDVREVDSGEASTVLDSPVSPSRTSPVTIAS